MSYLQFINNMDNPTIVWKFWLAETQLVGTVVTYVKDSNGLPMTIMVLLSDMGRIVEIPWVAIKTIETEINNG